MQDIKQKIESWMDDPANNALEPGADALPLPDRCWDALPGPLGFSSS